MPEPARKKALFLVSAINVCLDRQFWLRFRHFEGEPGFGLWRFMRKIWRKRQFFYGRTCKCDWPGLLAGPSSNGAVVNFWRIRDLLHRGWHFPHRSVIANAWCGKFLSVRHNASYDKWSRAGQKDTRVRIIQSRRIMFTSNFIPEELTSPQNKRRTRQRFWPIRLKSAHRRYSIQ